MEQKTGQRRTVTLLDCIERIPSKLTEILDTLEERQAPIFAKLGEERLKKLSSIVLVGSGSSSTSATTAAYFMKKAAKLPVHVVIPSEFCHQENCFEPNGLYVFISQTGTSRLTGEALALAENKGLFTVALCEEEDKPFAKGADCFLQMGCGCEEYPMRTIGFSATVFTLQMLALSIGQKRGVLDTAEYNAYLAEARSLPELLKPVPALTLAWMEKTKWQLMRSQALIFTGSGAQYGIALESAVKAWETPKITAAGLELEEGMHGANYGYNHNHCVIVFNDGGVDDHKAKALSGYMREVFQNGLLVGANAEADCDLPLALCGENFCCLQFAAVGQTLTYELARAEGRDLFAPQDNSVMERYFKTHDGII